MKKMAVATVTFFAVVLFASIAHPGQKAQVCEVEGPVYLVVDRAEGSVDGRIGGTRVLLKLAGDEIYGKLGALDAKLTVRSSRGEGPGALVGAAGGHPIKWEFDGEIAYGFQPCLTGRTPVFNICNTMVCWPKH